MARRKLNLSPDEWDALPWHHQRLYLDGMQEEFSDEEGSSDGPETDGIESPDALDIAMRGAKIRRAEKRDT